jgi:hypothetical protein
MEQWLPLERFGDLSEDRLCKRLKIFIFLPPDGGEARRKALFEKKHNVSVPKSTMEADAAAWGTSMRLSAVAGAAAFPCRTDHATSPAMNCCRRRLEPIQKRPTLRPGRRPVFSR